MQFYYSLDGKNRQGPLSREELKLKLQSGIISPETKIWHKGMPNWQRVSDTEALRDILLTVPPPLPNQSTKGKKTINDGPRSEQAFSFREHEIAYLKFCGVPVTAMLVYLVISGTSDITVSGLSMFVGIQATALYAGRYLTRDSIIYHGFIGYTFGLLGSMVERKMEPNDSEIQVFTFWLISIVGIAYLLFICWLQTA